MYLPVRGCVAPAGLRLLVVTRYNRGLRCASPADMHVSPLRGCPFSRTAPGFKQASFVENNTFGKIAFCSGAFHELYLGGDLHFVAYQYAAGFEGCIPGQSPGRALDLTGN